MNEFYLRTESIKQTEIQNLSVVNATDRSILGALKANEPCLLEGSRGTGKSFLMRLAELELEAENDSYVTVFVPFNMSSLISTEDNLQFYHWMLAKTLKYLLHKLRKKGVVVSSLTASLLSNDENDTEAEVESSLKDMVGRFEDSYKGKITIDISALPDIEDVKEAIQTICEDNGFDRIIFFLMRLRMYLGQNSNANFSTYLKIFDPHI